MLAMDQTMRSDADLMLAVGRGDLAAFEEIVLRHQSAAWGAAWRFLGDAAEAEDVVQDAFLKVLDAAPRYAPTAAFRTYLFRVVTRLCLDRVRKRRPIYTDDLPVAVDAAPAPLDGMAAAERDRAVRQALDGLPPNQRMALVLRHYEDLAYREIAAVLGTSEKAVERLIARARETLADQLKDL